MTPFLENICNWHSEIEFPPFRISSVRQDVIELAKTMEPVAILLEILTRMPIYRLKFPEYGSAFWPGNIAGVLEELGIDSQDKFNNLLGGQTCTGILSYILPPKHGVDKKTLPLISSADLLSETKAQCFTKENISIFFGDAQYWLCPQELVEEVLKFNLIDKEPYSTMVINNATKYVHDCDNFAMSLAGRFSKADLSGLAFGQCWIEAKDTESDEVYFAHALNIFCNTEKKIWLVEPQTDQIFEPKQFHSKMGVNLEYRLYFGIFV